MAAWKITGLKTKFVAATDNMMNFVSEDSYALAHIYKVERRQYTHKSEPDLHKVLIRVISSYETAEDLVFLQY